MKYSTKTKRFVHWAIGGLASCFLAVTALGQTNFTQGTSITINDNSQATPYPSPNVVQNTIGTIEKVTVTLNGVSHTNPDDIDMALVGPDGTGVMLMSDAGGQFDLNNTTFTLDSTASTPLPDEALINSGTYYGTNYDGGDGDTFFGGPPSPVPSSSDLSVFNGKTGAAVNGTWKLYVADDTVIDAGSIRSWSLNLYMSPTLLTTNSVAMTEDTPVTVNVFVNDTDTPLSSLNLSATSSDQSIIKDSGLAFGGDRTGTNRTLTITPVANANGGPVTITVTIKDEQGQVIAGVNQKTFTVNVAAVNDVPTVASSASSASAPQGGITLPISLLINDVDSDPQGVQLTATTSDSSIIPATNVLFRRFETGGTLGTNRTVQIAAGSKVGTATITILATDSSGGTSSNATINVTVPSVPSVVAANPASIAIPISGAANPYPSTITIPSLPGLGLVGKVVVSLINIEHPIPSEIGVLLVDPTGHAVALMRSVGGTAPVGLGDTNDVYLTFDKDAATTLSSSPTVTSTNRPLDLGAENFPAPAPAGNLGIYDQDLNSFRGSPVSGDWKLYVYDTTIDSAAGQIAGGWSLQIFPAPTIATIPDQTTTEDTSKTITFQVGDFDGSVTNISAQVVNPGDSGKVTFATSVNGTTGTLVLTPAANFNSATPIPIRVTVQDNSGSFTASTTFNLMVTSLNDLPTMSVIPKQVSPAGESIGPVPFTVGDVETDPNSLVLTASSDNPKLLPTGAIVFGGSGINRTISIFPAGTQASSATVVVTVTDTDGGSSSQTFTLTVQAPANPLFENNGRIVINDATSGGSTATPYPDPIAVSGLVGTISEVRVTLLGITHPTPDDLNILLVGPMGTNVVLMGDAGGNNPITNVTLVFDQSGVFLPDNTQITSGTYRPSAYQFNEFPFAGSPKDNTSSLDDYIGAGPNGTWNLYVYDDTLGPKGGAIEGGWQLSIRTRPQVPSIPDQITAEDTPKRFSVQIGDVQPGVTNTVTSSIVVPAGQSPVIDNTGINATITDGNLNVVLTPFADANGTNVITLTVTDPDGFTSSKSFNFDVTPVDDAPRFGAIARQTTPATTPISFNLTVADPEGTAVTVTASADPASASIVKDSDITISPITSTTTTRTITILPEGTASGQVTITLTAADSTGQKSSTSFVLDVTPTLSFENPDGRITINDFASASPYPSTIPVSGINGTVSGVSVILLGFTHPFPDDVDILLVSPDNKAVMLMSDAGGSNAATNLRLTFSEFSGNQSLPDEGQLTSSSYFPNNYGDPNESGEMPSPAPARPTGGYSVNLNDFAGVNPNGNWKLYVQDDTFPQGGSIDGWILSIQTAPTISAIATQTTREDAPLLVPFTVSDQDTSARNLTVTPTVVDSLAPGLITPSNLSLITNGNGFSYVLTIVPTTNRPAGTTPETNSITLSVTDGTSTAATSFKVVVTPVDDAPVITTATNHLITLEDSPITLSFTVADIDSSLGTSSNITVFSSNSALATITATNGPNNQAPNTPFTVTVTVTPVANANDVSAGGPTVVSFVVSDRSQSVTNQVTVDVTPVNDLPTVVFPTMNSVTPATNMIAGGTIGNIPVTVNDAETPPRNLNVTATSEDQTLIPNLNVIVGGSGANRTITLTSIGTAGGTTKIDVVATDELNGSTTNSFAVTVTPAPSSLFGNSGVILIPATGTIGSGSPYPSVVNVSGLIGNISDINVTIDGLSHTAPDDLDILLVGPTGKKVMLLSDVGGANPISNVRLIFDQINGRTLGDDAPIVSGTYLPADFEVGSDTFPAPAPAGPYPSTLQEFINTNPNGQWQLFVVDDTAGNAGQIQFGWSLKITTAPTIVLNTATPLVFPEDNQQTIQFTIADQVTPVGNLVVLFNSDNPNLIASITTNLNNSGVVTATITPVTDAFGTNNLTITVRRSDGAQSSIVVPMNITPVNDLPELSRFSSVSTPADTSVFVPILIRDVDTPLSNIWVRVTSGNQTVITDTNIFVGSSSTNFLHGIRANFPADPFIWTNAITLKPNSIPGTAIITVDVFDTGANSVTSSNSPAVSGSFAVTVTAVNHSPTITSIPSPQPVEAGKSSTNIVFSVGDIDNDTLTITTSSDRQDLVKDGDIIVTPGTPAAPGPRTVQFTTQPGVQGDATITISVRDTGNLKASTTFIARVVPTRERILSNNSLITIQDNSSANPYPSQIPISGFSGNISKVTVTLNGFSHTFPDDVDLLLVSPHGEKVIFMSDAGGGTSAHGLTLKFDDTAATVIPDATALTSGTFQPFNYEGTSTDNFAQNGGPIGPYADTSALTNFNGFSPNGTWSLYVIDDTAGDSGSITNGWSLGITTLPILSGPTSVTSSEDVPASVDFTIAEESFGNPDSFGFNVSSSNPAVVPSRTNNIVITGRGSSRTVTVIPAANASGTAQITLTEQTTGVTYQFSATFTPVNDAPTITQVPDQTLVVGSFITVTNINFSDVETPKKDIIVRYDSSDPGAIPTNNIVLVGNDLKIFSGTRPGVSRITITVTDTGDGVNSPASTSMSFVVTVSPGQNPVFANTDGITIPVVGTATPYPSTIEVRGVDGTITKVSVTLQGFTHTFPDDVDMLLVGPNGKGVVLMSDAGASTPLTNAWLTFDDSATQSLPDNSAIQPFDTYIPSNYEVSNSEFASPAPAGPYSATFSGAFNGNIPNGTWSLYVQDDSKPDGGSLGGWSLSIVTTAPTVSTIPDQILVEDTSTNVNFNVSSGGTAASNLVVTATLLVDDRGPLLEASRQPDGSFQIPVTGTDTNRSITLTPTLHVTGTTRVIVSVTDGTSTNQTSFNVVITAVNHAPVITGLSDTNTPVNVRLRINFTATDVETATSNLVITATNSNDAAGTLTLDTTGATPSLVFNPAGIANTNTTITVVVSDGTLSTTKSFVITVTPAVGPTISAIPNQTIDENTSVQVAFTISSPSTNVTVSAFASNARLVSNVAVSAEGNNRTALITLNPNQTGFSEIDITVTDDFGSATAAFGLVVNKVPVRVTLGPIGDITTTKNGSVQIVLPLINPDTNALTTLTFSGNASNPALVSGVTFEQAGTNEIASVNLAVNQTGLSTVTISVTDGSTTTSRTFALNVIAGDTQPRIETIGGQTANEDVPLTLALQVSDPDTQISDITFTGTTSDTNLVSSITFNNSNGTNSFATNVFMTLNLVSDANGTATITVVAQEGTNTVTQSFVLTVLPVDDVPVLAPIADQIGITNSTILVPVQVTDIDTLISQLNVSGTAGNSALVSGIRISNDGTNIVAAISLVPNAVGTSPITITVNEGTNSVSQSFNLTIRNQPLVPAHLAAARLPNGDINITVTGAPGATYVIQKTSDFVTWTNVGQVTIDADGSVDVSDGTFRPYQFYRAVAQ